MNDRAGKPHYFEDFAVDQQRRSLPYQVHKDEIIAFAKKWDPQPFHVDEEAAKASFFGGLTCCSAHTFSIFCAMSQNWESGEVQQALASLGFDEMRMLKPVYAGDTLLHISTVEDMRESASNPTAGIVVTRSRLYNQEEVEVFSVKCAFLVKKTKGSDSLKSP